MARVWWNGEIVDEADARTSALDRGLTWGWGLFETLRCYGGRPWALGEHMERLRAGAVVLDLPVPTDEEVARAFEGVMGANGLSDCGVRITVTAGSGPPDPHEDPAGPPNVLVTAWPLRDYSDLYARGARLVTLVGQGRAMAGIKSTSYGLSVAGRIAARRGGADDALFVEQDGRVLETTGANLFAIRGSEIVTAPTGDVLPGVTRGTVLQVARELGLRTVESDMLLDDLFASDEVVLTSSLREVYGVSEVDGRPVRTGPLAAELRAAYRARVLEILG
ncbi:MAG TPA: aminotransferase class IV [Actinomycetota bacterium]|nr:aminotransferase class IV [Actinomycetota bacterium]